MAAKQLVTNIHKRLNNCAVTVLLITTVSCWASRIAGSEEDRAELRDALSSGRPTADEEGVMLADMVKAVTLSSTLKLLKLCRSVSRKFDLIKMLLTSSFKTATHKFQKNRKQSQKSDNSSPSTTQPKPCSFRFLWRPQRSHAWEEVWAR